MLQQLLSAAIPQGPLAQLILRPTAAWEGSAAAAEWPRLIDVIRDAAAAGHRQLEYPMQLLMFITLLDEVGGAAAEGLLRVDEVHVWAAADHQLINNPCCSR